MNQTEKRLLGNTDAKAWAEEFVRLHGGDEGLMITWFANAIETGSWPDDDHLGPYERPGYLNAVQGRYDDANS